MRFPGPDDVGQAWVIEADGTEPQINTGDWITRTEAERLAAAGGYSLHVEALNEAAK